MPRKFISPRMRFEVLKRDGFACVYCGAKAGGRIKLVIDHVHPFSQGGADELSNFVVACQSCNAGKSDYPVLTDVIPEAFTEDERDILNHGEAEFYRDPRRFVAYVQAVRNEFPLEAGLPDVRWAEKTPGSDRMVADWADWDDWTVREAYRRLCSESYDDPRLDPHPHPVPMPPGLRRYFGTDNYPAGYCAVCHVAGYGTYGKRDQGDLYLVAMPGGAYSNSIWMCRKCAMALMVRLANTFTAEEEEERSK